MMDGLGDAPLEEIAVESDVPVADPLERAWRRVRAGLYVDGGTVDVEVVGRWQRAVVERQFDLDTCASELIASSTHADETQLLERCGRLMRDFVMASMLTGSRGAARKVRGRSRTLAAMLLSQSVAIGIYSLIVVLSMLFMRLGGTSFDGFFDRILSSFGR